MRKHVDQAIEESVMSHRLTRPVAWAALLVTMFVPITASAAQGPAEAPTAMTQTATTPAPPTPASATMTLSPTASPASTMTSTTTQAPSARSISPNATPARVAQTSQPVHRASTAQASQPATSRPQNTTPTASTPPRSPASPSSSASMTSRNQTTNTTPFQVAVATRRGGPVPDSEPSTQGGRPVLPPPVTEDAPGTVVARPDLAAAVLAWTNQERARHGLAPLAAHPCISGQVAQPFAITMAAQQRTYHNNLRLILSRCGGRTAGENVSSGYTTPQAAVAAWMGSSAHRANILNQNFTTLGVGVAQAADGTYYWVQNFNG